jgi:hypothetical protein
LFRSFESANAHESQFRRWAEIFSYSASAKNLEDKPTAPLIQHNSFAENYGVESD